MNLSGLHERIARWEDLHTEFKEWPMHPDDLAASLVAFANTDGGQLIFGAANSRFIARVENSIGRLAMSTTWPLTTASRPSL